MVYYDSCERAKWPGCGKHHRAQEAIKNDVFPCSKKKKGSKTDKETPTPNPDAAQDRPRAFQIQAPY